MNTKSRHLLVSLLVNILTITYLSSALAEGEKPSDCVSNAKVEVGAMGMVDEVILQKHIDKMQGQLKRVRHARGSRLSQKTEMKQHISDMQAAMQELHKEMYVGGCKESMHGAPVEVRVEMIQKRMDAMQKLLDQLLEHIAEQEKE